MLVFWREGVLWFGFFAAVEAALAWGLGIKAAGLPVFLGAWMLTHWAVIRSGSEPGFATVTASGAFAYAAFLALFLILYGLGCATAAFKLVSGVPQCDGNRWLYIYPAYHLFFHVMAYVMLVLTYRSWKWRPRR